MTTINTNKAVLHKKESLSKFAALSIVAATVSLATISLLANKDLIGHTPQQTIDNTSMYYIGKSIFASQEEIREYTFNKILHKHPEQAYEIINNLGQYNFKNDNNHAQVITKLKEDGLFEDEARFVKIIIPLLTAQENNLEAINTNNKFAIEYEVVADKINTMRGGKEASTGYTL